MLLEKKEKLKPHWELPVLKTQLPHSELKYEDPETGVILRKLSNGIRVNFKRTQFEAKQCAIRINAQGGRSIEQHPGALSVVIITNFFMQHTERNFYI